LIRSPVLRLRVRHDLQLIAVGFRKYFHVNLLRLYGIQYEDFHMVVRSDPAILQEFLNVQNLNAKDHSIEMCLHIQETLMLLILLEFPSDLTDQIIVRLVHVNGMIPHIRKELIGSVELIEQTVPTKRTSECMNALQT